MDLNETWTADVVGRMHRYKISNSQLAAECEYTPAYLSTVLNGKKTFETDEAKQKTKDRILNALADLECRITNEKDEANATDDTEGNDI